MSETRGTYTPSQFDAPVQIVAANERASAETIVEQGDIELDDAWDEVGRASARAEAAEAALADLRRACHLPMPEGAPLSQSGYVCALCLWDADPDDPATHEPTCPLFEAGDAEGEDR